MNNSSSMSSVTSPWPPSIPSASCSRAWSRTLALFLAGGLFYLFPLWDPSCDGEDYSHPRLFFGSGDLAEIRARRLGDLADEWASLLDRCEYIRNSAYPSDDPAGEPLRNYDKMLLTLAFVQLIDPSQPYGSDFADFFWTVLRWSEWDTDPGGVGDDLGTLHLIRGLAIAYDWQYDSFSSSERQEICGSLATYMSNLYGYYGMYRPTQPLDKIMHNIGYNAHNCLAAVVYGVDDIPAADYADWTGLLDDRYALVVDTMNTYMRDGASNEGGQYYTYGLENLFQWFEMERRSRSLTGGAPYDAIPFFRNTSLFMLYLIIPGGSDNYGGPAPFADSQPHLNTHPRYMFSLLASRLGDPVAQWLADDLDLSYTYSHYEMNTVWRYIYSSGPVAPRVPGTLVNWHLSSDIGLFAWRTGWNDDATYFALRSGRHYGGHCQPDDGQFVIFRAGIPYVVDLGYEDGQRTGYHNVLLVGGEGQITDGGTGQDFPFPDDQGYIGKVTHVLATGEEYAEPGDFFDVVADPAPMYTAASLSGWTREAVGFGDLYLVRDVAAAAAPVEFELRVHSYVSSDYRDSWEFQTYRDVDPFTDLGAGRWEVYPRADAGHPAMLVTDLSASAWDATVEETWYDDWSSTNRRLGSYLSRRMSGTAATSLLSFSFDDQAGGWVSAPWADAAAEGLHVTAADDGSKVIDILWPLDGSSCTGSDGWDVSGTMAGRRHAAYSDDPRHAFFAREATLVREDGVTLLSSSSPVSVHAALEHGQSGGPPNRVTITAGTATEVRLLCPNRPLSVYGSGTQVPFAYDASREELILTVGAGAAGTFELSDDPFRVMVNFQPGASTGAPGCCRDDGSGYGTNGPYGWD